MQPAFYSGRRHLVPIAMSLLILIAPALQAQVERISLADDGSEANAGSYQPALSGDGSVVAFRSNADNLDAGDTNAQSDIFVRDLGAGTTRRVSLQPDGSQSVSYNRFPGISDDGTRVVFAGAAASVVTVTAIVDLDAEPLTVTHLLPRDQNGFPAAPLQTRLQPALSGNGRFVTFHAFHTFADAHPASVRPLADDTNGAHDVFVLDIEAQPATPLERVSRDSLGDQGRGDSISGSLSDNGRWVAFDSLADDLVPGDANEKSDVFIHDRDTGTTELVSADSNGLFGNDESRNAHVSGNGQFVAFRSRASNLVEADDNARWDIFVRDRGAGTTERVSVSSTGVEGNNNSMEASISDDGRFVAFRSLASNLVVDDENERSDIFVHDRDTGETVLVSRALGEPSNGSSANPAISGDGAWIAFESDATNLVAGDANGARDLFRVPNPLTAAVVVDGGN